MPQIYAQHLYDLREMTGFISGEDLHELFREFMDGEPSPSGYLFVDIPDYHWVVREMAAELETLSKLMESIKAYSPEILDERSLDDLVWFRENLLSVLFVEDPNVRAQAKIQLDLWWVLDGDPRRTGPMVVMGAEYLYSVAVRQIYDTIGEDLRWDILEVLLKPRPRHESN